MKTKFVLLINLFIYQFSFGQNVHGIDVSNWQGTIDWNEVANDGQVYAWAKASEGMTYQDPQFNNNMTNGLNAGIVMGAYHFARPDNNLASEDASNFLSTAGAYIGSGFLPPVLDLENPYSGGQAIVLSNIFTSNELSNWVLEWMNIIHTQTGIIPIIYVNGNYANYLNGSVNTYGLWFAQPDELLTPPVNLGVWNDWQFKQYSWWGEIPGIIGDVDLNIFNGSISEFNDLIGINTAGFFSSELLKGISFFPNPVLDQLNIYGLPEGIQQIQVSDCKGKKLDFTLEKNKSIDVSILTPGIYFLHINMINGHSFSTRFIKR
ncbi:MAG: GH25 family lysozyme [Crocinitomicaceae bacterium]|nr:GH25 family lysozyme [Crocinitomicaceae bacterium]